MYLCMYVCIPRIYSSLEKASEFCWSSYHNRPGETLTQTNLHLEPHDYRTLIYFISIEFLSLSPWRRGARRN